MNITICKLRRWIFNKRHEHLLPTFLLRYEVYTYGKLTARRTQRPHLNFLRKLRKFWFDHNMATTLDLPLPLNILEDFSSQQLKTSTSFHRKKILQVTTSQLKKKNKEKTSERLLHIEKWTWALFFVYLQVSGPTSKTSDFLINIWISKKKKNPRTSPSLSKTSRFPENEPAKKKTTLASPFPPQRKETFFWRHL